LKLGSVKLCINTLRGAEWHSGKKV